MTAAAQLAMFTDQGENVRRRVDDLLGRAFELHCEADEVHVPWALVAGADGIERVVFDEQSAGGKRVIELRRRAVALEREADDLVPVEERTWLR